MSDYKKMTLDVDTEVKHLTKEIEMLTKQIKCPHCGSMVAAVNNPDGEKDERKFIIRCKCGKDVVYTF